MPVAPSELGSSLLHFNKLADYFILATLAQAKTGCVAARLSVLTKMFEAGIAVAGPAGSFRIHLI